jgi:hypothetical protein
MVTEEDNAQLQAVYHLADSVTRQPTPTALASPARGQHVIEYYSKFNSLTVLGEAFGRRGPRRLVRIALPAAEANGSTHTAKEREVARLDPVDAEYLRQKKAHVLPPTRTWYVLHGTKCAIFPFSSSSHVTPPS